MEPKLEQDWAYFECFRRYDCRSLVSLPLLAACLAGLTSERRDITGYTKDNNVMEPLNIYKGHTAIVEVSPPLPSSSHVLTT